VFNFGGLGVFSQRNMHVVSAKGFSLFIQVGDQLIMIDMREKIIREAKI